MLGYVVVNKDKLSEEDFDIYRGYYCGVCKSIGRRFGELPRICLSYDAVFLAMVLSSLEEGEPEIKKEHCIIHPIQKNPVIYGEDAVDYAADMLIILAYHNFLDDKRDEHPVRGSLGASALKGAYEKLAEKYPLVARDVEDQLNRLSELEASNESTLDETSEVFGKLLASVFLGYFNDGRTNRLLKELAFNLGKWIYIIDAIDDLEKDKKKGSFNPLISRERGLDGLDILLYNYLGEVMNAVDLMDIQKNRGIIENVILLGLRARTELLLNREGKE